MATKHVLSAILIMVVLSASIYLVFDDKVRIDIENTRTKYFVMEDNSWTLAATEYVNLYDGTTKMRAVGGREITYFNDSVSYSVVRTSKWKQNITTIQTYKFYLDTEDITEFPSENTLECINCQGKIVHYEIRDILYDGETQIITSPFSFGHQMKIEWQEGAYFSKVYQQKISDKIIIKYRPVTNYETYSVRLFDPPNVWFNSSYHKCKEMNVTGGTSDLINFTFFSNVTYDSEMQSDFDDIIFVNAPCNDGGELMNYEIDYKVDSVEALVWIISDNLSTGINQYSMYYNNSLAINGEDKSATWDDYYKTVWHFSEVSNPILDSTGLFNFSHGTSFNQLGNYFGRSWTSGLGAGISCPTGYFSDVKTIEGWGKRISTGNTPYWIDQTPGGVLQFRMSSNDVGEISLSTGTPTTTTIANNIGNNWNDWAFVTSNILSQKSYVSGDIDVTSSNGGNIGSGACKIWSSWDGSQAANMQFDELRFSTVIRSPEWIKRGSENSNLSKVVFGPITELEGLTHVILNSPNPYFNSTSQYILFNCSTSGISVEILNISLIINDEYILTIFNTTSNQLFLELEENISIDYSLEFNDNSWTCIDDQNSSLNDQFFTIIEPINSSYTALTEDNNSYINDRSIFIDLEVVGDAYDSSVYFLFNESLDLINESIASSSFTFFNLSDGNYSFNTTSNNTFFLNTTTALRSVSLDSTTPLIYYVPNSDVSNNTGDFGAKDNIFVNVTVVETNEENITFKLYTGFELINITTFTDGTRTINWTNLPEGMYFWNVTVCDLSNNCNTTEERFYGIEITNLTLELGSSNLDAELGGDIDVNATYNFGIVCVDVDHPDYGQNYSCGTFKTDFSLIIDYFRKNIFNDSTTSKVLSYVGEQVKNVFFPSHKYDEVDAFSFNITGANESGYPENVLINKSNSSIDRFFPGLLIGSNIFLDKDDTGNTTKSLFYGGPGIKIIRFFMDDGANLVSAYVNISGFKFGDSYIDEFDDESVLDEFLNEGMFRGGFALPKGENLKSFVYDPFTTSSVLDDSLWTFIPNGDYSLCGDVFFIGDCDNNDQYEADIFNSYVDGKLRLTTHLEEDVFIGERESEAANNLIYVNFSKLNIYTTQEIKISIDYQIDGFEDGSTSDCTGDIRISLGEVEAWRSPWQHCDDDPGFDCTDGARDLGGLTFSFVRQINNSWNMTIEGTAEAFGNDIDGGDCGNYNFVYNYTAGSLTKTYNNPGPPCAFSGSVEPIENTFTISNLNEIIFDQLSINQRSRGTYDGDNAEGCRDMDSELNIAILNYSLYSLSNSSIISGPVIETASDISSATLNITLFNNPPANGDAFLFLSANGGVDWENVQTGVEHTFTETGTDLRYRVDFNLSREGYVNTTLYGKDLIIVTPEGFPSNITIDFGNDGIIDGSFDGELNSSNSPARINLSTANLTIALNGTPFAFDHLMKVPMNIYSDSVGQLNISEFEITYNPNPIRLNISAIFDYIFSFFGFGNFPISIESINGNITVYDVRFDYAGGNSTFEVLAHNQDYTFNSSLNITYFYSSWDYRFVPEDVEWIYFAPKNSSDQNVQPYGQTNNTAIINITNYGYGGRNATLSIYENDTNPCINTTLSTTNNKADGIVLNQSWQDIINMSYLDNTEIYLFADYSCNDNTWAFYDPDYYFRLSCIDCISSEDII